MYIDTHCHLDFENYNEDREKVIQRAIQSKVDALITIGTNIKTSEISVELAKKFALIYAAVGIHPNDSSNITEKDIFKIEEMSKEKKVVAIGEIGLDYYRTYSSKEQQKKVFRNQLKLARKVGLPVIIHNREAFDDLFDILVEERASDIRGVFHSFSGGVDFLESILPYNFYVSFTGSVTFKSSNYDEVIEKVPLENLLLETDSPFLAPVPFRGKRNEPAYIKYTAEKIAQIKGINLDILARRSSENAKKLFNIEI